METKVKLVLAGNYSQHRNYLRENKLTSKDARYICEEKHILGLRNVEIVRVGTWWNNPMANSAYLRMLEDESY